MWGEDFLSFPRFSPRLCLLPLFLYPIYLCVCLFRSIFVSLINIIFKYDSDDLKRKKNILNKNERGARQPFLIILKCKPTVFFRTFLPPPPLFSFSFSFSFSVHFFTFIKNRCVGLLFSFLTFSPFLNIMPFL